jgi:hypothetical protein
MIFGNPSLVHIDQVLEILFAVTAKLARANLANSYNKPFHLSNQFFDQVVRKEALVLTSACHLCQPKRGTCLDIPPIRPLLDRLRLASSKLPGAYSTKS